MWWFLYGLISGAGIMRLIIWVQDGYLSVGWYIWPLIAAVIAGAGLTVQHFFASFKECEPRAAWMGLLFMGGPTLVTVCLVMWVLF
jgi:hypothetical protein